LKGALRLKWRNELFPNVIGLFCARLIDNFNLSEKEVRYAQKIFTPEQILAKLRQISGMSALGR
jgi:hypothetical protein